MTSRAESAAAASDGGLFVSAFHGGEGNGEDDGVATPEGFQNTPDQWHSAASLKKRGSNTLADAPTQRDSQATQLATEVQSFDPRATQPDTGGGATWPKGPSFVDATGSLSSNGSDRPLEEDVDEDETQIIMSLSQDRGVMRKLARRIEEEELEAVAPPSGMGIGDQSTTTGEASDADSDLSDDMLEQDGDINGLSSIAKSFQLSEVDLTSEKKPAGNVYKPRMPFQITPPTSVVGDASAEDDSSGAETEVDEEPEAATLTVGTSKLGASDLPPVSAKKKGLLGKRSVSETGASLSEAEVRPKRYSLERSASYSEVEATPDRSKRARVSLVKPSDTGKPPLSRPKRLRLDSVEETDSVSGSAKKDAGTGSASSSQELTATIDGDVEETAVIDDQASVSQAQVPTTPSRRRASDKIESSVTQPALDSTPARATSKSNRKRKLVSTENTQNSEEVTAASHSDTATEPCAEPTIRVMFTGLDGTMPKLRDKVKKIADAIQEDDDIDQVTHLVAPKNQLKRTVKLLCGISCCDHILDERWLDESARSGVPASEKLHCLKDTTAEAKWNFSLYRTMYTVPKDQRRKLFDGLHFFITNHKSILPPVKDLLKIIQCAGGHAEMKGTAKADDIVITSETALPLVATKKALLNARADRIYTPEFILSSILQQDVDFNANQLTPIGSTDTSSKKKRGRK